MKPNETSISENSSENLHVDEYDQLSDLEKIQLSTLAFNNATSIANNLSKINQINHYTLAISNAMSLANNLPKLTSIPQIPNISSIMSQYTNILSNMHLNSFTIAQYYNVPKISPAIYQYSNILSQISIPTIPNHICTAIQQSIRIQDKISYNKDLISSFTSKLKDTEYYDETLVNNLEDINPLLNELEKFPEYQEQFIQKAYSYIDKIVEAKVKEQVQEELDKIKTSDTTKIEVTNILIKAHDYISNNLSTLCDFYIIAPDSMKSDISLICFWLVVVLFAIPVIDFYYNYFNK
nr:MAG: hypothetical protein [Bacteriophage sp.]